MWQILAAICVWLLYEWYEHKAIKYTTTEVECKNLKREVRACLITDLHNNKKNYSNIVERIDGFHPEVILLAGDMVDKHDSKNQYALAMLEELSRIAPVLYSEGNHEGSLSEKQPEDWDGYVKQLPEGVTLLKNAGCFLDAEKKIYISGLSLPKCFYKKGSLYQKKSELPVLALPEADCHIMLAHNPEYADMYERYHADVILSGHLHGGLLRLPVIGGVVSPRLRFPVKDAGLSRMSFGSQLFISRGLGSHTIPLRFFNRVEINFLVLTGTKEGL